MINETKTLTMNSVTDNQGIPIPLPSKLPSRTPVESYQLETEMKLLFVNPNLRPGNPTGKFLPVGLAYVMTVFRNAGLDYDLLDICINDYSDDYVEAYLETNTYDVVLIGSIITHYKWMKWFVHMLKRHQPDCKVIVGNSVSGSIPSLWMLETPTDYVVTGEGEWAALDIIRHLGTDSPAEDILGITFRCNDGSVTENEKRPAVRVQDIPMIDWTDFDVDRYIDVQSSSQVSGLGIEIRDGNKLRVMPVSTARGCVFKCTFCHYVYWDDPYRHRSAEDILAECLRNIDSYDANYINFWDDLSFHSVRSAERVVDAILCSDVQFYWSAAIRADLFGNPKVSEERRIDLAHKFRESGCVSVGFSLESGNNDILTLMDKRIRPEFFDDSIRIIRESGITVGTSVVFGYPNETPATIKETFAQCARNEIFPSIGILIPLPYTKMYEYAKEHGYIVDEDTYLTDITERQDLCVNMTNMSDEDLLGLIREGAEALDRQLGLGLDDVFRTGGEVFHTRLQEGTEASEMIRNSNDFSFNYSTATFNE